MGGNKLGGWSYVATATRLKSAVVASSIFLTSLPACSGGDGTEPATEDGATATSVAPLDVIVTAMTPCMLVQSLLKGSYYLKAKLVPGNPIDVLYLGRGSTGEETSGAIDLGARYAIATVDSTFWDQARVAPPPLHFAVEYLAFTGEIIAVYEC